MTVQLSSRRLALLERAFETLLSPLSHPDDRAWRRRVNRQLAELFGADHAVFVLVRAGVPDLLARNLGEDTLGQFGALLGLEPEALRRVDPVLAEVEARRAVERPEVWSRVEALRRAEGRGGRRRSLFAHEVLAPIGLRRSLNLEWSSPLGQLSYCVSSESAGDGAGAGMEPELLRLLLPAFRTGVAMLLDAERQRADLDASDEAVLVLDAAGRELHRSPALRRRLGEERSCEALEAELRRAGRDLLARGTAPERLRAPWRCVTVGGSSHLLRARYAPPALYGEGAVLVSLERPGTALPGAGELRARFGLTAREAEVARLLAERRSNREIAERLALSPHTVRHHAESVFLKLDVHSRRELPARLAAPDSQ